MPLLTREDQAALLGPTGRDCDACHEPVVKGYCRACDEFYFTCACPKTDEQVHRGKEHRTYEAGSTMGVFEVFGPQKQHLQGFTGDLAKLCQVPEGSLAVQLDVGADGHGSYRRRRDRWVTITAQEFWAELAPALHRTAAEIEVAVHVGTKGEVTRTVLRGERYVSEVTCDGALLNRAENTDRFYAGMAHMAFHLSWTQASASNLAQAVTEAKEEGYTIPAPAPEPR